MATAITITSVDNTQNNFIVRGTVTLTASYSTGGDALSFASQDQIKSSSVPIAVRLFETTPAANGAGSGYAFNFLPGTTQANGVLTVFNGITQYAATTYGTPPFAVTNFQLSFEAVFPSFL